MSAITLDELRGILVKKIPTAKYIGKGAIHGGSWQPSQNECHANADTWCALKPEYKPVRGWLYFNQVRGFLFHSVVRKPNGDLADITPSNASNSYPFIEADIEDEVYFLLELQCPSGLLIL